MVDQAASASSHNHIKSAKQVCRFPDLRTGGLLLAEKLRNQDLKGAVVLAIALGGVPVGREVATQLGVPFDIVLIRRLLAPTGPGSAACAVSVAGTTVLDEQITVSANPSTPTELFIVDALNQFHERENLCREHRPSLVMDRRKIILVDCAVHTASTMKIAIRALRKLKPARIISAVPVASRQGQTLVETLADEAVCLAQPEPFGHAGMWYEDFSRPGDEQIHKLLDPL